MAAHDLLLWDIAAGIVVDFVPDALRRDRDGIEEDRAMGERNQAGVLNHLIRNLQDAERGFRHLAQHATNPALKSCSSTHRRRSGPGSRPTSFHTRSAGRHWANGTAAGALHRTWIDLRAALSRNDQTAAVRGPAGRQFSLGVFKDAIEGLLPPTVRDVVASQYQLQTDHSAAGARHPWI